MPTRAPSDEHRRHLRHKSLKGAHIVFNNLSSSIDCLVRDLSEDGARLDVETLVGIPDSFELVFADGSPPRQCAVLRRSGRSLGVRFTD